MPIYEYQCEKCGKDFELFRSITDDGRPSCKFCGGPVKKLISRSSFHLKGTGWYVTDYAGKKTTGPEEKKEASSSASSSESSKKEESPGKSKSGSEASSD